MYSCFFSFLIFNVYYYGQGAGDLYIKAECTFVSETYIVQDCFVYDTASSNKTSNYNTTNATLSHNTDHYESISSNSSSTSNYFAFISHNQNIGLPRNVEVELDIKQTNNLNGQWGVSFTDSHGVTSSTKYATCGGFAGSSNQKGIICNSPWGSQRTNGALSLNTWYHFKITVTGTSVSFKLMNGDSVLFDNSLTVSFMSELVYLNVHQGQAANTVHFKNLKIKAL